MEKTNQIGLYVLVVHHDGFRQWYHVNELIDAIIIDRVHFPSETYRTISTKTHEEYLQLCGYGPENPEPFDGKVTDTCYHFCKISDRVYKVLGNQYTNNDARGR